MQQQGPLRSSQGPNTGAHTLSCDCAELRDFSSSPSSPSWLLPPEVTLQVFLLLDPTSLCRAAQTCRLWHQLIHHSDRLWRSQVLLLRGLCCREVLRDRGYGLSWRVTLVRNYARSRLKRDWLRGRFSCMSSANELRDVRMVPFDTEAWGEILQAELDR